MAGVPPVPYQSQVIDDSGLLTTAWAGWIRQASDWSNSLAATGYQKLPGGLYIQWGVTSPVSTGSILTVTLPIACPTACLQVIAGIQGNTYGSPTMTSHFGTGGYTATTFDLYNLTGTSYAFNWIALGY